MVLAPRITFPEKNTILFFIIDIQISQFPGCIVFIFDTRIIIYMCIYTYTYVCIYIYRVISTIVSIL